MLRPRPDLLTDDLLAEFARIRARLREAERPSAESKAAVIPRVGAAEASIVAHQAEITAHASHIISLGSRVTGAESELGARNGYINDLGNRMVGVESGVAAAAGTASSAQQTANTAAYNAQLLADHATALRNYMVQQGMNPPPPPVIRT